MIANSVATSIQAVRVAGMTPGRILDMDESIKSHEEFAAVHHGEHGSGYVFNDQSMVVIHRNGHVSTVHVGEGSPLAVLGRLLG